MLNDESSVLPESEFALYGGRACLNLAATLSRGHYAPVERLPDGAAVARWLAVADIVPGQPLLDVTERQRDRLIELRSAVDRLVRAAMADQPLPGEDVRLVNDLAARATFAPQLVGSRAGAGTSWTAPRPFDAALSTLARDTIDLLSGSRTRRVRECAHPDCSRLFLDESQSGARRWCSMERCGNLAKIAGYRARRRTRVRS